MQKIISAIVVLVLIFVAVILFKNKRTTFPTSSPHDTYYSGPFAYKITPIEKLGISAKLMDVEISHAQLLDNSPVLKDLIHAKFNLLTKAIDEKLLSLTKTKQKANVTIYMESPSDDIHLKESSFNISFSDERPKNTIVNINTKNYSREELPLNQVRFSEIETKIFDEKLRVLSNIYTKNLLLKVAKNNNTTIQSFINKTILKNPIQVTDVDVQKFADDKGLVIDKKDSSLKERLRSIIKENKTQEQIDNYIATQHANEVGKIYFHPPTLKIPLFENKAVLPPSDKPSDLPTFMVFSRLKCTSCSELADTLEEIRKQYKNKIRIGFIHYFSNDNWQDSLAAEASMCLNLQSHDAFWDFFNKISKTKEEISESLIMDTAKSTNVNFENFKKCFLAQTYKDEVQKQMKYAEDLGVTISPTVIYDTKVISGKIVKKQLKNTIESSL
ncbi:MAG: DsbA family protein [Bdellovibrionales bacterium]|nr:DsbA family protein [Bdellovibrionales bacterium]